ncbi:MAG: hypothetical protein KAY61_03305, partial [Candidatus Eisenbacteria bacterium]|nr:hypothetical protein [Candidatus Eisenbacteria bacterium]
MRFLILLVALLFVASPAAAEWSSSPVTNLTVCSAANSQFQDYVISDGVGGAYVAWVDPRSGGIYHLYAQHYDGRGNALWAANGLSIGSLTTFQGELVACGDGVGGLILAWRDDRNAGVTGTDIYVQRLNSSGAALWTANGLAVCTAANTQQFPKIVSDGAGGVFVAWSDWRDSATSNSDVYAQHVLSGGTMAWTANGVVACNATASQLPASLAPDGYGGVVVSWTDSRNFATTGTDLYAQRITSTGAPQWTLNGLVICNAAGDVTPGPMVADGTGTVWMAWTDTRAAGGGSNWDIYAQAVNSSGSIQWGANGYAVCTQTSQQRSPQIWLDGSGSVYLAWTDTRPVTAAELYGQRMSLGG